MYFASTIFSYIIKIQSCHWDDKDQWEYFFRSEHNHVFKVIPYHLSVSIIVLVCIILNFQQKWAMKIYTAGIEFRIYICVELHGHIYNVN